MTQTYPPARACDVVLSVEALRVARSPIYDTAARLYKLGAVEPGDAYCFTAAQLASVRLDVLDLREAQMHWLPELLAVDAHAGLVESSMCSREGDVAFALMCRLVP